MSLDEFDYEYAWLENGKIVRSGKALLSDSDCLDIPLYSGSGELFLNVYAKLKKTECWADKGFCVAKEQFRMNTVKVERIVAEGEHIEIKQLPEAFEVIAGTHRFLINTKSGALTSWQKNGVEILYGILEPYFWKPANNNQIVDEKYFYAQLRHFVLFRTMQVLGAYGFRGYFEKKPHFIQSVPFAIENLRQLLQEPYPEYPYLCHVLKELTELKQFTDDLQKRRLVVKVTSFAYKKGIPEDSSGNGGGFVFDCRAVNNPGKYDRYKPFTGLDEPVIRFLEDDGEITTFLEHVYGLVDASVKRYMERGFTNLSICFGCTGGQHRSVYSAQHLAEHLNQKFGVQVNLIHREQNIEQTFKAKS